jgi:hypothetical protein
VPDLLAEAEVFEEIARAGLGGGLGRITHKTGSFGGGCPARPFSQNREPNASFAQRETDEGVCGTA